MKNDNLGSNFSEARVVFSRGKCKIFLCKLVLPEQSLAVKSKDRECTFPAIFGVAH